MTKPVATDTFKLPSGNTAEIRRRVQFGATMALDRISARTAAASEISARTMGLPSSAGTAPQPGDVASTDAVNVKTSPEALEAFMMADKYFRVCYMVRGWTCTDDDGNPLPLPTLDDLSPLEELDMADGKALLAECQERYDRLSGLDTSPNPSDEETPTASSSESAPTLEETAPEGDSLLSTSSIASSV